jgi:SprT-like family protein/uncharacterized protein DUF2786
MNAEFEALILNELKRAWNSNVHKFKWNDSGIQAPNFKIADVSSYLGQWTTSSREMCFATRLVTNRSWNEVLEVLKHEMAHQYVHEVLGVHYETSHGPTFQLVCKQYKIDPTARGEIDASQTTTTNHIVEKIQHLLKLADNAGASDAEKEAAATAAHNMMLKYNIELQAKNEERGYTVRYLGGVTGRIQTYMSEVATLLVKYYFVECIWMSTYDPRSKKKGHELEVCGREENVEVADYVYDFLTRSAVEAWERKMKNPAFKFQLHQEFARNFGSYSGAPQSLQGFTTSARSNFLTGFIQGFKSQLKAAEIKEKEAGLILAKDAGLDDFYHDRHPHIRKLQNAGAFYQSNMRNQGFSEGSSLRMPAAATSGKKFTPLLNK